MSSRERRPKKLAASPLSGDDRRMTNPRVDHDETLKIRRLWTEELYREYDHLVFLYRLRGLRPPVIMIADLSSVWGRWDPLTRTLTLSAALIARHAWDVVIEVLKHEMAHQVVTELFGGDHTHGALFQRACTVLGVADWAAQASGALPAEIPSWRDRALSEEEEKLLRRAEKLLSLAASSNEHEAVLAMERVRELYARHNLERLKSKRGAAMVHLILTRGKKRIDAAETMIGSILVEHFFVKVIFADTYDAPTQSRHKVLEVMGADENVLMAEYVYHFLYRQAHALWDDYRRRTGKGIAAKTSFLTGVLAGFREKLRKHKPHEETQALVALTGKELEDFVARRHPRLVQRSVGRGRRGDHSSFHAGVAQGERLTLNKPVSTKNGPRGLALPS